LIFAEKLQLMHQPDETKPPEIIDPGHVGNVTKINPLIITTLSDQGFIPVIAPVGVGVNGETYNINADLVASKVACALSSGRLIYLTDVDGVKDASGQLISSINAKTIKKMVDEKTISGGMIPKIEYALGALKNGVKKVQIINGTKRHALLLELFTDKGIGTEVIE
ncbi:MAG: acetylglutamate kinase, partial [Spirochaetales bacterium]|nr:acetylglutamate kinase [Spirochaetales bacterium]